MSRTLEFVQKNEYDFGKRRQKGGSSIGHVDTKRSCAARKEGVNACTQHVSVTVQRHTDVLVRGNLYDVLRNP